MAETTLLNIKDLSVEYRTEDEIVHAVNSLDLKLNAGENLGLVGETGAGKTTTALSILRLVADPPGVITGGEILFQGEDLLKAKPDTLRRIRGNKISMIFQDPMTSLNPVFTAGEQIADVIRLHQNVSKLEAREKAMQMLEMVGIPRDRYDEYPHQFSGGMKQRVVIAMSIACSPQLLLADEPTTALDVTIQAQVLELMNELKTKLDTAMILITHDLGIVAQTCDKVAIMYAGEIVESGTIREVFEFPHHPYTIGLFDSIPTLDSRQEKLKPIPGQMPDPTNLPVGCPFQPRCEYVREVCGKQKINSKYVGGSHEVKCLIYEGKVDALAFMEVVRRGR